MDPNPNHPSLTAAINALDPNQALAAMPSGGSQIPLSHDSEPESMPLLHNPADMAVQTTDQTGDEHLHMDSQTAEEPVSTDDDDLAELSPMDFLFGPENPAGPQASHAARRAYERAYMVYTDREEDEEEDDLLALEESADDTQMSFSSLSPKSKMPKDMVRMSAHIQAMYNNIPIFVSINMTAVSEPTFTRFSELPVEIRAIIWDKIKSQPRLIEVSKGWEYHGRPDLLDWIPHAVVKICKIARKIPAILHVNHESRQIGLYAYTMVDFTTGLGPQHPSRGWVFFNLQADIVYVGEEACICTLQMLVQSRIPFSQVAVHLKHEHTRPNAKCCNFSWPVSNTAITWAYGFALRDNSISLLRIFHGFEYETSFTFQNLAPVVLQHGHNHLQDVYFVSDRHRFDIEVSQVSENVELVPSLASDDSMDWMKSIVSQIKSPPNPSTVPSYSDWRGNSGPTIHYVKAVLRESYYTTQEQYRFTVPDGMHILDVFYESKVWYVRGCEVDYEDILLKKYNGEYIVKVLGKREAVAEVRERLSNFLWKNLIAGIDAAVDTDDPVVASGVMEEL